jgi:hypothetical protein
VALVAPDLSNSHDTGNALPDHNLRGDAAALHGGLRRGRHVAWQTPRDRQALARLFELAATRMLSGPRAVS